MEPNYFFNLSPHNEQVDSPKKKIDKIKLIVELTGIPTATAVKFVLGEIPLSFTSEQANCLRENSFVLQHLGTIEGVDAEIRLNMSELSRLNARQTQIINKIHQLQTLKENIR